MAFFVLACSVAICLYRPVAPHSSSSLQHRVFVDVVFSRKAMTEPRSSDGAFFFCATVGSDVACNVTAQKIQVISMLKRSRTVNGSLVTMTDTYGGTLRD